MRSTSSTKTKDYQNNTGEDADSEVQSELVASRRRFLQIIFLCLFFPSSFMIWGMISRRWMREPFGSSGDSSLSPLRQAHIARERDQNKQLQRFRTHDQWNEIIAHSTDFLQKQDSRGVLGMRMEAYVLARDYKKATEDYITLFPLSRIVARRKLSENDEKIYNISILALQQRDDVYRKACQQFIEHISNSGSGSNSGASVPPWESNELAWVTSLHPRAVKNYQPLEHLSQEAVVYARDMVKQYETTNPPPEMLAVRRSTLSHYLSNLGLVYYRAGKFTEAMQTIKESEGIRSNISNWILFVKLYEQLSNKNEAKTWRAKIKEYFTDTYSTGGVDPRRYGLLLLIDEMCPEEIREK
jgi:tetratricopeptide (TPR) repeat protein